MTTQNPKAVVQRMMDQLDTAKAANQMYRAGDVKTILNQIMQAMPDVAPAAPLRAEAPDTAGCRAPVAIETIRRGDVFIASTIGGKVRPWVVLRVIGDEVAAMPMSSSETRHHPSRCRFWPGSYIGGTIATFTKEQAMREITRPYTARAHLAEVERDFFQKVGPKRRSKAKVVQLRKVAK